MTILPRFSVGNFLSLAQKAGVLLAVYWLVWLVYAKTLHPLAKVPGPLWPSLSRTWLMMRMYFGDYHMIQVDLHNNYGPLVRIAPNELSYSKPDGVSVIYRLSRPLEKTDWYWAFKGAGLKSQIDMFTITNEKRHSAYRRLVGTVYSLSNILKNEKQMDENVQLLLDRLDGFVERKEEIDLGLWLEMYAYDNIGSVFFGKPFGFLDTSSDHGGYIAAVHKAMPFLSVVSMAPTYARMALMMVAITIPSLLRAVLAVDDIRKASVRETQLAMARKDDTQRYDMLSRLIDVLEKSDNSTELTHHEITGEMWVAVIAGADSTAGALRAITYHLIKHPRVMAKLTAEIDQAFESGALTRPMQHSKAITLPYLMAVCKEAARVWPAFQVTMPRYAPAHGLQLPNGFLVPEGYSVGMSPFVVQRDTALFGEDAETFRPERWLEANKELLRQMNTAMISFGAGTRTCTGQHMAMTEIYKIIREIVRRYEVSMPVEREWRAHNASFNLTSGIVCAIRRRDV